MAWKFTVLTSRRKEQHYRGEKCNDGGKGVIGKVSVARLTNKAPQSTVIQRKQAYTLVRAVRLCEISLTFSNSHDIILVCGFRCVDTRGSGVRSCHSHHSRHTVTIIT